jgi:energy-coupling factor transport system ATP-binding protein
MDTPVILLDEPSSALDARSRSQLVSLILALREEGKTVVFTTNRPEECEIADQVISLDRADGGAPAATFDRPAAQLVPSPESPAKGKRAALRSRDQETLARLRKGAEGSWSRLDTPLHRLPPVFKYIFLACAVTAALAVQGWQWLCVLSALELIPAALARYSFRRLAIGIIKILPWFVFLGVIQYLFVPDVMIPVIFFIRFIALYIPLVLFVFATSHTEIMYGMEDFLRPLKIARVPVRDVALVTGIVFRFIPLLYEEAARITAARIIRSGSGSDAPGKKGKRRGVGAKISSMASLFVPLVIRTLIRADRLASAVTARYYGNGKNSRYLHWKIGFLQSILGIAVPVLTGLLIFLSMYTGNR